VENLIRTANYVASVADRQVELRALVTDLLAGVDSCVLEIGCGHGHFLSAYAAAYPSKLCIGIDIISDRIDRANRKKDRARLGNLHFIHANADDLLASLPSNLKFSEVFVLFPDPWPKRRHHKNRLIQPDFLLALRQRVGEGARLYFRTDDENYFAAAVLVVKAHPAWEISTDSWAFECETVFQERASGFQSLVVQPK
jgi:tRNA (guanine-N7-)-methyltransferase